MKFLLYIFNFNKIKKKYLIIFFYFVLTFIIFDRLCSFFLNSLLNLSTLPHAELYAGKGKSEIIILGDSRGYRSFDENYFSNKTKKKTRNYSLIGGSTLINEIIIKDYLDIYNEPPKIILFEISNLLMGNEAIKEFRVFGYKSKRISDFLKNKYPKIYYGEKLSNLFQFNNETFFNGIQKIFIPYKYKSLKGFMNNIIDINKIEKKTFNANNHLIDKNIESLQRIIKLCEEKNIKLYLVIAPFYPNRLMFEEDEFNFWVKKTKKNIKNIPIINFSKNIKNEKYFYDWKHINNQGIKIFNKNFFDHQFTKKIFNE